MSEDNSLAAWRMGDGADMGKPDSTLSMMEYEVWRTMEVVYHINLPIRVDKPLAHCQITGLSVPTQQQEPGASLLDSLLGPGLL